MLSFALLYVNICLSLSLIDSSLLFHLSCMQLLDCAPINAVVAQSDAHAISPLKFGYLVCTYVIV